MAVWAIIPAAGVGRRFGADVPKQYLEAGGKALLAHVLELFLNAPRISGVVLASAADDERWRALVPSEPQRAFIHTHGGATRAESVFAALEALADRLADEDWVLVHDAARPCLAPEDLEHLLETLVDDPVGGLLAAPVVDTLKRSDEAGRVGETVERTGLWRALTPQMFRYRLLRKALSEALAQQIEITDESAAMEWAGHMPRLVTGSADNIKVTRPSDLLIADTILRGRK